MKSNDQTPSLDRVLITKKALEILDQEGIKGLTMRNLGRALGVDPMAIYYHLPNKDALLDEIVDGIYCQVVLPQNLENLSFFEQMMEVARSYYRAVLSHPNSIPIIGTRSATTPNALLFINRITELLAKKGFDELSSINIINCVGGLVMGVCLAFKDNDDVPISQELLASGKYPYVVQTLMKVGDKINPIDTLEFGLSLLFKGFESKLQ